MVAKSQVPTAVFIVGIAQRCGTNHLHQLLCQHPDCFSHDIVPEDYINKHIRKLTDFSQQTAEFWTAVWDCPDHRDAICQSIGNGLISFLAGGQCKKTVVTKTPSAANLDLLRLVFPSCPILLLVRDGRDLVESSHRSFGRHPDLTAMEWAYLARAIHDFVEADHGNLCRLIRYEDLHTNPIQTMEEILEFLGKDLSKYNFDDLVEAPIIGSSTERGGEAELHWKPVPKTKEFSPIGRHASWSRRQLERFNWLAGESMVSLDYYQTAPIQFGLIKKSCHRIRDIGIRIMLQFRFTRKFLAKDRFE